MMGADEVRYIETFGSTRSVQDPRTFSPQHADLRLLAIPTSKRRVSAFYPNWDRLWCDLLHITASLRIVPAIVARF